MQVYDIILRDENGCELARNNVEAADDESARDLLAHYYADQRCELWRGDRLLQRHRPSIEESIA